MTDKRVFLAVPYAEREAARAAGARWDATLKSWYIGRGADRDALAHWLPERAEPATPPRDEFIETMIANGLLAIEPHPIGDGKAHRVPVEGDKQLAGGRYPRPSGRYALHLDGHPAGFVRNFRKGIYAAWKSTGFRLPPHEMAALRAEVAEKEKQNATAHLETIEAAARRAQARTARLVPAIAPTAYMAAKGIQPTKGALTDTAGLTTYLPAIDIEGKQWTLQTIRRDGLKLFLKDSRKEGTFHIVGGDLSALEPLLALVVAEGYATAVIVSEALDQPTIAAFDAGNLPLVATALHGRFPAKAILIAGDDDHGVELREGHNPGRDKAGVAAAGVGGAAVFPEFAPGEQESDPKGFTDFHDLATRSRVGRDGLKQQIETALQGLLLPPGGVAKEAGMADNGTAPRDDDREGSHPRREQSPTPPETGASLPHDTVDRALSAGNSVTGGQAIDVERGPRSEHRTDEAGPQAKSYDIGDVPPELGDRYRAESSSWRLQRDYYESNTANRPVFHDQGHRLLTDIESAAVIADMVAIAKHRGWESIDVAGTEEFRRDAWVRARTEGIEVRGYRPTERDVQELQHRSNRAGVAMPAAPEPARMVPEPQTEARVYLAVPFAEKEAAKAAGARWDRTARSWYADERQQAAVARWLPDREQAAADRVIARDPAAREQMRTIETVVGATLANDPEAAKRLLSTGREALAAKVERGETIPAPALRQDRTSPEVPVAPAVEPAPATRRPPNRSRSR